MSHLADSRFTLLTRPMVRTILNEGGSVYLQPASGPGSAPGFRMPEEIGKPVKAAPARVDQVSFRFEYGAGEPKTVSLMVAPLP
jgi:hypothetical protein